MAIIDLAPEQVGDMICYVFVQAHRPESADIDSVEELMRVLLIEKKDALSAFLTKALKDAGFAVHHIESLEVAKNILSETHFDTILFDGGILSEPVSNEAFTNALQEIRRYAFNTPLIPIVPPGSAINPSHLGEYSAATLIAPFAMEEMVRRVKAAIPAMTETGPVTFGDLELDSRFAHLRSKGMVLPLTRKEAALLEVLMRKPNIIIDRSVIEQALYGGERGVGPNALEVLVSRLRKKLVMGKIEVQLLTVRGAGYMLMGAKS